MKKENGKLQRVKVRKSLSKKVYRQLQIKFLKKLGNYLSKVTKTTFK